jgi:hypothetical protein
MTCPEALKASDGMPMASAWPCSQDEKDDRPFATAQKVSDRDCDNIPGVVSKIDHDVRSRRRKLVLSPHCLWLPFSY